MAWDPPANPDPFADRTTAGGAGMMRVSGAFAARLSAPADGERTLNSFRLLGEGLIGNLESAEDFRRTEIFGEGGWVSWPLGKNEKWQAKGIPLGLPSFDLQMDIDSNDWRLFDFQSDIDRWFAKLSAAQSFSGNYYDLSPGGAGHSASSLPIDARLVRDALNLASAPITGFAKVEEPQALVQSATSFSGLTAGAFASAELAGAWTMQWSINDSPANLELRVTAPHFDNWIPTANFDEESEEPRPGKPLPISAEVVDPDGNVPAVRIKKLTWKLVDTSREPGIAMNFPFRSSDTSPDIEIGKRGPSLEKKQELIEENLTTLKSGAVIVPWDFGGWSTLRVEALLDDGKTLMGKFRGPGPNDGKTEILLPDRDASSKIQRTWRLFGFFSGDDTFDDDRFPSGKTSSRGDGFSAYEEYRGFFVSALVGSQKTPPPPQRRHLRLRPNRRNVFFFDQLQTVHGWLAMGLFQRVSGATSYVLWPEDELSDATSRLANPNRGAGPTQGDQHVVRIGRPASNARAIVGGDRPGRSSVIPPFYFSFRTSAPRLLRSRALFQRSITQGLFQVCGVPRPGDQNLDRLAVLTISRGDDGGPVVRETGFGRVTLRDESGHDLGEDWLRQIDTERAIVSRLLRGRPGAQQAADAAAAALAKRKLYVAGIGGPHSGPLDNIMRDTFADAVRVGPSSIIQLPKGYSHRVGYTLSSTAISDEPMERFGDSVNPPPDKEFTPNDHR